jgi:hypothetical protein
MEYPTPTLLGYRARRPAARLPDSPTIITHIASACDCITIPIAPGRGEPDWINLNRAMHYPTPQAALAAALGEETHTPQSEPARLAALAANAGLEIHATRLYPWICYGRNDIDTLPITLSLQNGLGEAAESLPSIATFLGLDVIALAFSPRRDQLTALEYISFGCAPLSCNHEAKNYPINRWCLLDNIEDARRAMEDFTTDPSEPGPYMIAEVWRCTE